MSATSSRMEQAQASLNMIILDACRADPFQGRSFVSATGLAPMQARAGTIISYATQPGAEASDGAGDNSPFVLAILEVLRRPHLEALEAFNQIGVLVRQRTGGVQVPWMSNSPVETRFVFNPGTPPAGQAPRQEGRWAPAAGGAPAASAFVVSAAGQGTYRTVQEAIDAAPDHTRIVVEPGRYTECLRIAKRVEIQGQGNAEQVVIEVEGREEPAVTVTGGPVSLLGLTFRTKVNYHAVIVRDGAVVLENCIIQRECAVSSENERAEGVLSIGAGVNLTLRNCRLRGFRWGATAIDGAQVVVEDCDIRSDWARGNESPVAAGLWAGRTGRLEVRSDTRIEAYWRGVLIEAGGSARLSGVRIVHCYSGIAAIGEGASATVEECELEDVDRGIQAGDGSRITVTKCDVSYLEAGILAIGGIVEVNNCARVQGTQSSGSGVTAENGSVTLRACRIFGGAVGCKGLEGGTIIAADSEIWDVSRSCVDGDVGSIIHLASCNIHHAAGIGVWSWGKLSMEDSEAHDNGEIGVVCAGPQLSVKRCVIYRNAPAGIVCQKAVDAEVSDSKILLNKGHGITFFDQAKGKVEDCIVRQNSNGAGSVEDTAQVTVIRCNLHRNRTVHSIEAAESARLTLVHTESVRQERVPTLGAGGTYNTLSHSDFFYAETLSKVMDKFQSFASRALDDWRREAPEVSPDGNAVTYKCSKSFTEYVQVVERSWLGRLIAGLTAGSGGAVGTSVHLPYELRITVTFATTPAFRGMVRVDVQVNEEEQIDQHGRAEVALGRHYSAPSVICREQAGRLLLDYLEQELTPALS